MMNSKYKRKLDSREAWLRRQSIYWNSRSFPRLITRIGEIYEIDFGENIGTEFSGRHLAICLKDTLPSEEKMLVIPLTSKFIEYNINKEDVIKVNRKNGISIHAGVALHEARWISKIRIFRTSKILNDPKDTLNPVKGYVKISKTTLKRWTTL